MMRWLLLTLLLFKASNASAPDSCIDCCNDLGSFGLGPGERGCCRDGCDTSEPVEDCDNENQQIAAQIGLELLQLDTPVFVEDTFVICTESSPGVFEIQDIGTPSPTGPTTSSPSRSPIDQDATDSPTQVDDNLDNGENNNDNSGAVAAGVTVSIVFAAGAGIAFVRYQRSRDVENQTEAKYWFWGGGTPLRRQQRKDVELGARVSTRGSPVQAIEDSMRSGMLSYRGRALPEFKNVDIQSFLARVSQQDRQSFSEFKRLSSTFSNRTTVYFQDVSVLNIQLTVQRVCDIVEPPLETRLNDDGYSGIQVPDISLEDFLLRLIKYIDEWYLGLSPGGGQKGTGISTLILSLIYQKRMKGRNTNFKLSIFNVHRVFAVTMLLAAKYSEDDLITNKFWSKVCLIELDELNKIEALFVTALDFNLYVTPKEFKSFVGPFLPKSLTAREKSVLFPGKY